MTTVSPRITLSEELDSRIIAITPNMAIEWGYNLYVIQVLPETSETRRSAMKAVQELEDLVDSFSPGSPERIYLTTLRMAAISFGQGVERRKGSRATALASAVEEKEDALDRITRDTRRGGLLAGGWKILLLGGFVFFLVRAVFGIHIADEETRGKDVHYVSMSTALGIALIGAYIKGWFTDRKMRRIFREYDIKVKETNESYAEEVVCEYRLAAQTADMAWHCLTDVPAPMTKAFESLLLGVIKGYCATPDDVPATV
ncbi:MAG: hypothetical protein SGJ27_09470 [Candidatus Melainabacteria bacterium]|nr:hypothetical protein [Candidatus Melainabacteria bacterium]